MTGRSLFPLVARRLACGLLLLAGLSACSQPDPLRIGLLAGLSGSVADLGESGRAGAQLAVEESNQAGGIQGRRLELIPRDDAQDPQKARAAIASFRGDQVVAIIGPMTSAMAEAVLPVSNEAGLTLISPTATASSLSGRDDQLLTVLSTARQNAHRLADHHASSGLRRIAAIYDTRNNAYSQDWLVGYRETIEARGGRLLQVLSFTSGDEGSYLAAVRQLRGRDVDGIMYVANAVDTVRLLLLVRQAGLKQPALGVTWSATEQLLELGGRAVEGMVTLQLFNRELPTPRYQAFLKDYRQRFNQEPGFASIAAYDAAQATIQALRKRKDGQSVKAALLESGPYQGLQEAWNFDRNGDVQRATYVATVKDGRFLVVD